MDELRKIPPVTRTLLALVLTVSLPPMLQLVSAYPFLLWWPAVLKKQQVWRLVTCFFFSGGGLQMLFDLFMLGRNAFDLEINHFHRSTADFTWAILVVCSAIMATNYPLQSAVLFNPFLMAVTYLWARSNPTAVVNLFGVVSCPASLLPYAYLSLDLIRGGYPLFIQSSTGLLSAYLYWQLRHTLPSSNGGRQYIPTPQWLHRLLAPSIDPVNATAQQARNAATPGGRGGQVLGFSGGTMFAPRGRTFGDNSSSSSSSSTLGASSTRTSWSSYLPSLLGGGGTGRSATGGTPSSPSGTSSFNTAEQARKRAALLDATERRLKAQRQGSIAEKNAAAAAAKNKSIVTDIPSSLEAGKVSRSTALAPAAPSVPAPSEATATSVAPTSSSTRARIVVTAKSNGTSREDVNVEEERDRETKGKGRAMD